MDVFSQGKPHTKKRKLNHVVPASMVEISTQSTEKAAKVNICSMSDITQSPESTVFDKHRVPFQQYSSGLATVIPCEHSKRSSEESEDTITKTVKAESLEGTEVSSKDVNADLNSFRVHSEFQRRVNTVCSYDEALAIRYHARTIGLEQFFHESIVQHRIPLQTLCSAFCVFSPAVAPDPPDTALLQRLKKAITTDMGNRIKLHKYNSVDDAIALVKNAKNVMVITGAGTSTSLDIPDFRSHDGLYSRLREMGFEDPESIFSRDTFEQDPRPFFSVAAMILPPMDGRFTPAHAFLRLLQDKDRLLTLYTQNIDGIDLAAGIRRSKLVQLHGSFETATCTSCEHRVQGEEIFPKIRKGEIPKCEECHKERQGRLDQMVAMRAQNCRSVRRKTQRSSFDSATEPNGILRPDIVFMGEPPKPYLKRFGRDCAQVDLLIVMGTSLPVEPVNTLPNRIPPNVPQIYIGKKEMYPGKYKMVDFDIQLLGECDVVTEMLAKECGWNLKHDMLPKDTSPQVESFSGQRHIHYISREQKAAKHKIEKTESE